MSITSKPTVHFDIGWRILAGLAAVVLIVVAVVVVLSVVLKAHR